MPKVSVIIPVYNAGTDLHECMSGVLAQTLDDIEVLCVDDGSTDGSAAVLEEWARADARVTVLRQDNAGAGAARNRALELAAGEYLSFLDADDLFEPTMLEKAYEKSIADVADICVFHAAFLDANTGRTSKANLLKTELLPGRVPFSIEDIPDHILDFAAPAPWNKLFRRAFVLGEGLRFQELPRANDFLFTKLAMVKAKRITVLDDYLVYYRVGATSNLQSNNDKTPLVFHEAHVALKQALIEAGVFSTVERGFVNLVLANSLYNLRTLKSPESFELLFCKLRDEYLPEMGVGDHDAGYFYTPRQYEEYARMVGSSPEAYLLDEVRTLRERLNVTSSKLAKTERRLTRLSASSSYKVGRAITYVPRRVSQLVSARRRDH